MLLSGVGVGVGAECRRPDFNFPSQYIKSVLMRDG